MAISFNLWTDFRESLSFYIFARKQHSDRFLFYLFAIQCKCISSSALKNRKLTKIHICARKTQTIKYHHDSWGQNIFKVLNRLKQWLPISISWRKSSYFSGVQELESLSNKLFLILEFDINGMLKGWAWSSHLWVSSRRLE